MAFTQADQEWPLFHHLRVQALHSGKKVEWIRRIPFHGVAALRHTQSEGMTVTKSLATTVQGSVYERLCYLSQLSQS